jgi:hypothetical protein
MKTILVAIYILGLWWVELNDAILLVPEQIFYKTHLLPKWTVLSALNRHTDMLPTLSIRRNNTKNTPV